MAHLITTRNLNQPDEVYAMLVKAHEGLSTDESAALNARLILTLFNHIGDAEVIAEALTLATGSAPAR